MLTNIAVLAVSTVVLTCGAASGTLTETSTITTVGTGNALGPAISGRGIGTFLAIVTRAAIGIGFASITNRSGGACVGVGSHTAIGTSCACPDTFFQASLDTSIDTCGGRSTAAGIFVIDFHINEADVAGRSTTEVIATGGATIATCTTTEAIADVAIGTTCKVGIEVMTTTPGWTIAIVIVLVTSIPIVGVFEVVGQGEQEVVPISRVTRAIPLGCSITTNQFAGAQLHHRDRCAFAIASTVECGRTCPMDAALVTEQPVLVGGSSPGVDLRHLCGCEQGAVLEIVCCGATFYAVVVGFGRIRTLTITSTFTLPSTIERIEFTTHLNGVGFAVITIVVVTVIGSRQLATGTLTVGVFGAVVVTSMTTGAEFVSFPFVFDGKVTNIAIRGGSTVVLTCNARAGTLTIRLFLRACCHNREVGHIGSILGRGIGSKRSLFKGRINHVNLQDIVEVDLDTCICHHNFDDVVRVAAPTVVVVCTNILGKEIGGHTIHNLLQTSDFAVGVVVNTTHVESIMVFGILVAEHQTNRVIIGRCRCAELELEEVVCPGRTGKVIPLTTSIVGLIQFSS